MAIWWPTRWGFPQPNPRHIPGKIPTSRYIQQKFLVFCPRVGRLNLPFHTSLLSYPLSIAGAATAVVYMRLLLS